MKSRNVCVTDTYVKVVHTSLIGRVTAEMHLLSEYNICDPTLDSSIRGYFNLSDRSMLIEMMCDKFPDAPPRFLTNDELVTAKIRINDGHWDQLGFLTVDMVASSEKVTFAPFPNEDGSWSTHDKISVRVSTIDLCCAVKLGWKLTNVQSGFVWKSSQCKKKYKSEILALKDNPSNGAAAVLEGFFDTKLNDLDKDLCFARLRAVFVDKFLSSGPYGGVTPQRTKMSKLLSKVSKWLGEESKRYIIKRDLVQALKMSTLMMGVSKYASDHGVDLDLDVTVRTKLVGRGPSQRVEIVLKDDEKEVWNRVRREIEAKLAATA